MIVRLHIQNYAIIDHLDLVPHTGLTIITGETGAGKSILLGALGLIMGNRADSKVLFDNEKKCFVEGTFDISSYKLRSFFNEHDLDYDDELIIRREIAISGKSRAFINDTPVTLATLKALSSCLVDMHQQFDTLGLQEQGFQIDVLDSLAGIDNEFEKYEEKYKKYSSDVKSLNNLKAQNAKASSEMDFLNFQLAELNELNLKDGEEAEISKSLGLLENSEEINSLSSKFNFLVQEADPSLQSQLTDIANQLRHLGQSDQRLLALYERLLGTNEELLDLCREIGNIADAIDFDEQKISELRNRQNEINRLLNKHKFTDGDALLSFQADLSQKTAAFSNLSEDIPKLEKEIAKGEKDLNVIAAKITKARTKIASGLEKKTHKLLSELSMSAAKLKIQISPSEQLGPRGKDKIDFLFATNVGSSFLPIKSIASGGEMSRLSLCIKSIVADAIALPTMIFDEIDTGVSGEVSLKMGKILKEISGGHQVLLITHSPPIAAQADTHLFIYKDDDGKRSYTHIKELNAEEKIFEVAKMMSGGDPPSERALANAEELIKEG